MPIEVTRTRGSATPRWVWIAVGAPFVLLATCGGPLLLMGAAVTGDAGIARLAGAVALLFLGAGVAFVVKGVAMRDPRRSRKPGAPPWEWDHPWNRDGVKEDSQLGPALYLTVAGAAVASGAATAAWELVRRPAPEWAGGAVLAFGACIGAAAAAAGGYLWFRASRYGRSELAFRRFPFLLGGPLEVGLVLPPDAPPLDALDVTLRFVRERIVEPAFAARPSNRVHGATLERDTVHEWKQRIPRGASAPGGRTRIRFDLPATPELATALSDRPARYWELVVSSAVPGIDYGAVFLVPVYAEPRT